MPFDEANGAVSKLTAEVAAVVNRNLPTAAVGSLEDMLGEALKNNGIPVKFVDARHEGLRQARMQGMDVFYGNPLSEYADRYMDLTGYTHLLAMSRNAEVNAIVCNRYRHFFGPKNVFSIHSGSGSGDRQKLVAELKSNMLFDEHASWSKLASLLGRGAVIKSTSLTGEYNFETHSAKWGKAAMPLFALDEKGKLQVFSAHDTLQPAAGWTLINLVIENDAE